MNFFEFVALLGALAWLPQIITFLINYFKKPKLIIISQKEIELGYTYLGPIINLNLAFLVENVDSLVTKIELQLIHMNKETHQFSWIWLEESLFQADLPAAFTIPYRKNQKAIAINIQENFLVEKKIGFQSLDYEKRNLEISKRVKEDYNILKKNNRDLSEIKSHSSYNDLLNNYKNSFIWRIGEYTALLKIYISKSNKIFQHKLNFHLEDLDITSLEININTCKQMAERSFTILGPTQETEKWEWVYTHKKENY